MREQNFLIFETGGVKCVLPVEDSERVVQAAKLTSYPNMPEEMEGMLNIGEELIPVIDLRYMLSVDKQELSPDHYFLVIRTVNGTAAIRAETLPDTTIIKLDQAEVLDQVGDRPEQIRNMIGKDDQTVLILDPDGLYPRSSVDFVRGIIKPEA